MLELSQEKLDIEELQKGMRTVRTRLEFSSAVLEDPNSAINQKRFPGLQVWDTTLNQPRWSAGWAADDAWVTWGS